MKGVKGRFLKKLKRFPTITTLKQSLILQVPDSISISKLSKDHKDEEIESGFLDGDKEKLTPPMKSRDPVSAKDNSELMISSEVQIDHSIQGRDGLTESRACDLEERVMDNASTHKAKEEIEEHPSLLDFEEKCPPGGSDSVIFYTTSLRGIRKTFEDCSAIRFLLESFRVLFQERDVSMHMEFREELWRMMGGRVVPPRLFIKGRHIGGADEVVGLHEQGKLKKLLEGIPLSPTNNSPCKGCGGMKFLLCVNCNGSCKVIADGDGDGDDLLHIRCPECNENGLIKCPICC